MERREQPASFNSDFGCNTPIFEEDLNDEEQVPYLRFSQDKQQASRFSWDPETRCRAAAALLALLALVLLIVNISLGVHYSELTDTHLTLDDTKYIGEEMDKLQDTYKSAIEKTNSAKKQLEAETKQQTRTKWELEHQTERNEDYKLLRDKITKDVALLRENIPRISDGCKYCPPGWIWMNAVCFYFPFSASNGVKTWQKAREFCQLYDGDLITIDSKDKQNSTVAHLLKYHDTSKPGLGYWIGLKDSQEEGTWKWLDGKVLVEGFWNYGEPNNANDEDCAAVYAKDNFFRAWNDNRCSASHRWICEKNPASASR